jgi:flagellar hook protein FlgE
MYSGVSGLDVHQQMMDVVGNNISNINTTGFKGSRVTFKEMLNQTIQNASGSSSQNNLGGINPQQIGLGVSVGSIDVNHSQGNRQNTGISTDLSIDGNGYFILNDGAGNPYYTRAGNFGIDDDGYLVNPSNGYKLQGYAANEAGEIQDALADLQLNMETASPPKATTEMNVGGNINSVISDGIKFSTSNDVYDSLGNKHTVKMNYVREIGTSLTGSATIGTNEMTISQLKSFDSSMAGLKINFNNVADEEFNVDYNGSDTLNISWDFTKADLAPEDMKEIEDAINQEMMEAGKSALLEIGYDGNNDDFVSDIQTVGSAALTLDSPIFGVGGNEGSLSISQDFNNPSAELNGMPIVFADNDGTLDGSYNQEDNKLTISGDWDNSNNSAPSDFSEIEAKINETLENNAIDGRITMADGSYAANNIANKDSLTLNASNTWDWNVGDVSGTAGTPSGGGQVVFDSSGKIIGGQTDEISFNPVEVGSGQENNKPVSPQSIDINFAGEENPLTQFAADTTLNPFSVNGYASGTLEDYSINNSGEIVGSFSNGRNKLLGQLSLASFGNPAGLNKAGDTMFSESENSGTKSVGKSGSGKFGKIISNSLEMSNVNLSEEFTKMITAQRGFQASSKLITTSDEMLQELVNLKR